MPNEVRRLIFSDEELAQALLSSTSPARAKIATHGYLGTIRVHAEPAPSVEMLVETPSGERVEIVIDETMLGAAVIRFCIDHGVPLPVKSEKSLRVVQGRLALEIKHPPRVPRPPAEPGEEESASAAG